MPVAGNRLVYVTKRAEIATSHWCARPDWDVRQNEAVYGIEHRPHGHNLLVEATVSGTADATTGMVTNIKDVKAALLSVLADYDHKNLNGDHPDFADTPPTMERILERIRAHLETKLTTGKLERVRLFEQEDAWYETHTNELSDMAKKRKDGMLITKRYTFSAAHRLHSPNLSEADNQALFMACNNPNGHGHNYTLEVTVAGSPDPSTGLAVNHSHLDQTIREAVVDRYNYSDLNELPEFSGQVTTSENIVRAVWDTLEKKLGDGILHKVRLGETRDNYFEYYG